MQYYTSLGIMTGTSCDGINGALMRTDGENNIQHIAFYEMPFAPELSNALQAFGKKSFQQQEINRQCPALLDLEKRYTDAVINFITTYFKDYKIDIIGFHGQTILHRPEEKLTVQIGDAALLAHATQTDVVYNFRENDLYHGGQGAPLVPLYHKACVANLAKPVTFINIGGITNVTYIGQSLMGFDIGIGNCVSDDLCRKFFNQPYDPSGQYAAAGEIQYDIAHKMAQSDDILQKPPKSFDRNAFDISMLYHLSPYDALATINYFAAYCIIQADQFYPQKPHLRIIAGGGVYNETLMNHLKNLSDIPVKTANDLNLNNNAIEAECFAWLAVRSLKNMHLTTPETTGVTKAVSGGILQKFIMS